ncbi:MAG: GHKL domain-containing protein [Aliivibrio sp.]|nr:GHKL domain-containing protein [Aliivibrio sp.]
MSVVHLKWWKAAEFSAAFGLTAFYMLKVGMDEASFLWLLLAFPVIWISLRHGFVWAAVSVFSINILALLIALDMAAQARVDLQLFLALVSLLGLLLGGLITSRRRAKTTVKNQHKTIAQLDRMKSMGDMAAKVYHEIGQPLSTLNMITQGAIDQLEKGELDAEGLKRIMKLSQRENTRLSNLVSSMKAFAKDGKLVRSDTSVQEIIGTIKSLTDLTAEMASMTVTYDIPKGPLPLNVDKTLIGQAIFNLVKNSIEAMENSKVKQVTISAGLNDNGHTYISVTDTGPGFPDDFALGQTTKPDGMGLGLQIVNDIMDSHGGVVELKSSKALLRI